MTPWAARVLILVAGVFLCQSALAQNAYRDKRWEFTLQMLGLEGKDYAASVTSTNLAEYLGVPRYRMTQQEEHHEIGLATGLAWTEVGGEILPIEVTLMPGKGALRLTGKLGEVMNESIAAALSVVRHRSKALGIAPDFYQKTDLHIHLPEGATPKDGPSAGVAIATAMVSILKPRFAVERAEQQQRARLAASA